LYCVAASSAPLPFKCYRTDTEFSTARKCEQKCVTFNYFGRNYSVDADKKKASNHVQTVEEQYWLRGEIMEEATESIIVNIHSFINGFTALCWAQAASSVS
jgi:hypothetical protein